MISEVGARAKTAASTLSRATTAEKDAALRAMADVLEASIPKVLEANRSDVAGQKGLGPALIDRLRLDEERVVAMAAGLREVADLPDPIGQITGGWRLPNGLQLYRTRVALGVVAVVYEGRPNVTADAAGLCVKSGNAAILRGSSTAANSNEAIGELVREALRESELPVDCVQVISNGSRGAVIELMKATEWVDLLIPRGGPGLIRTLEEEATVPYVVDGAGNCHVYVDRMADLDMAMEIVLNAKVQRPGVCNAAETLLVHEAVAEKFLPQMAAALFKAGVELRGDSFARSLVPNMGEASEDDWSTEYLDLVLAVRVVPDLEAATDHIRRYGTGHTEAVVTEDLQAAEMFIAATDSAVVAVNASTRFTDGEQFGFGAEIGISTQKLHVRGPMGLEALTTERYVLRGTGQVR